MALVVVWRPNDATTAKAQGAHLNIGLGMPSDDGAPCDSGLTVQSCSRLSCSNRSGGRASDGGSTHWQCQSGQQSTSSHSAGHNRDGHKDEPRRHHWVQGRPRERPRAADSRWYAGREMPHRCVVRASGEHPVARVLVRKRREPSAGAAQTGEGEEGWGGADSTSVTAAALMEETRKLGGGGTLTCAPRSKREDDGVSDTDKPTPVSGGRSAAEWQRRAAVNSAAGRRAEQPKPEVSTEARKEYTALSCALNCAPSVFAALARWLDWVD